MDPDGWPVFQLILTLFALFFCCSAAGVILDASTQKEIEQSGVGISARAVASILLAGVFAVLAMTFEATLSRSAAQALLALCGAGELRWLYHVLSVLLFLLLALLTASLVIFLPVSLGMAHSDEEKYKSNFAIRVVRLLVPAASAVMAPARRVIRARGMQNEVGGVTEEDVLELVDSVEEHDVIDDAQKEMISNIFDLGDMTAADIMTHRTEIEAVSVDDTVDDIVDTSVQYGFSRIPVYEGTLDNIIGIACVKDLLPYVGKVASVDIRTLLRGTIFVPESCRARELLFDFKQKKVQLAVVVDEYGGTAGIVTMEDILESIVGDITDEYDEEEKPLIAPGPDGSFICDGYADVDDVFEAFSLEPPEDDDIESDTVGGLLTELLMRIPKNDEHPSADYGPLTLTALAADERRVTRVRVQLRKPKEEKNGAAKSAERN
ncbi:MAG: hemolysin family protein [Oscillospiraceae bacterium]|nr:hemolysin family protein [Oscillospiraceae bacterium]